MIVPKATTAAYQIHRADPYVGLMNLSADPYGDTAAALLTKSHQNGQDWREMGHEPPISQNRPDWIEFSMVQLRGRLKAMARGLDRRRWTRRARWARTRAESARTAGVHQRCWSQLRARICSLRRCFLQSRDADGPRIRWPSYAIWAYPVPTRDKNTA